MNASGSNFTFDGHGFEFEPITRETVSSQIRAQLLRSITIGDLQPGARVPSERDLAERFQVARTSVREAIQGLVSLGVVERRGNRSYVVEHLPAVSITAADDRRTFLRQLVETRLALEVAVFSLAAVRADAATRAQVADLADQFHRDLPAEVFVRLDREFRSTVAAACGNPVLAEVYGKVLAQLYAVPEFEAISFPDAEQARVRRFTNLVSDSFEAIALAFALGDIEELERCAREQLVALAETLVEVALDA